jgi:hypothetical protein
MKTFEVAVTFIHKKIKANSELEAECFVADLYDDVPLSVKARRIK